jgi:4'-phosphopantetheinyl transferase EntD
VLSNISAQLRDWFGGSIGISVVEIGRELPLYPEEEAAVSRAVPKRRVEFSTGRYCAREALKHLGIPPGPIGVGPLRGPVWPQGTVGSITHSAGICAAIAGPRLHFRGLGLDLIDMAEAAPVVEAATGFLLSPAELDLPLPPAGYHRAERRVDPHVLRFSAKESVIKTISEEVGRWLEFSEITVSFGASSFEATMTHKPTWPLVRGYYAVYDGILLTAVKLLVDPGI